MVNRRSFGCAQDDKIFAYSDLAQAAWLSRSLDWAQRASTSSGSCPPVDLSRTWTIPGCATLSQYDHRAAARYVGCLLWVVTANVLPIALVRNRSPDESVFLNRLGCVQAITRHGILWMLRNHIRTASAARPSLLRRPIRPDTIRHTTATYLLRAGVDMNTIRAWLGHISIDTTDIYAEDDSQRKTAVLADSNTFSTATTTNKRVGKTIHLCSPSSAPSNSYVVSRGLRPSCLLGTSPLHKIILNTTSCASS